MSRVARWLILTVATALAALIVGHGWPYAIACIATAVAVLFLVAALCAEEDVPVSEDRGGHVRVIEEDR